MALVKKLEAASMDVLSGLERIAISGENKPNLLCHTQ